MNSFYDDLAQRLKRGFYLDNLLEIARDCARAALESDRPLGLFLAGQLLGHIDVVWRDKPMTVELAEEMRQIMEPPLLAYFQGAGVGLSPELVAEYLNDLVRAYFRWREVSDDAAYL